MKKAGRILLLVILACALAGFGYAAGRDAVVYITRTGDKYHTASCSSVRSSKIEITLEEAIDRGYEPCQRCKPPVLGE